LIKRWEIENKHVHPDWPPGYREYLLASDHDAEVARLRAEIDSLNEMLDEAEIGDGYPQT
jgi:hypothetical protein